MPSHLPGRYVQPNLRNDDNFVRKFLTPANPGLANNRLDLPREFCFIVEHKEVT